MEKSLSNFRAKRGRGRGRRGPGKRICYLPVLQVTWLREGGESGGGREVRYGLKRFCLGGLFWICNCDLRMCAADLWEARAAWREMAG